MIEILVYGSPAPAGSKTAGVTKAGRRYVRDSNPASREWKRTVSQAAGMQMGERPLLEGALAVEMIFSVARPKGHFGVRGLRPSAPAHPTTRPDVLKLARACEDALTGVVWRDDSQIVRETLVKLYAERACVRIIVTTIGQMPREEAA